MLGVWLSDCSAIAFFLKSFTLLSMLKVFYCSVQCVVKIFVGFIVAFYGMVDLLHLLVRLGNFICGLCLGCLGLSWGIFQSLQNLSLLSLLIVGLNLSFGASWKDNSLKAFLSFAAMGIVLLSIGVVVAWNHFVIYLLCYLLIFLYKSVEIFLLI